LIYGILDRKENLWLGLGEDSPPFTTKDLTHAELVKDILAIRLQVEEGRLLVVKYREAKIKRDNVTCKKTLDEALDTLSLRKLAEATGISVERLKKIEEGRIIQSRDEDRRLREALKVK